MKGIDMDRIEELEAKLLQMSWRYLGAAVLAMIVATVASGVYLKRIEAVENKLFVEKIRRA